MEVSAVILVESPHPDEVIQQKQTKPPALLHFINESIKSVEKVFDQFKYSEDEVITVTLEQLEQKPLFPSIPVIVVSGLKKMPFVPEQLHAQHLKFQRDLVTGFKYGQLLECLESGTFRKLPNHIKLLQQLRR